MTHLYYFVYVRTEPVYNWNGSGIAYTRTSKRSRRQVAPNLEEAIKRMTKRAQGSKPQVQVQIEAAHIYNHDTQEWERILTDVPHS